MSAPAGPVAAPVAGPALLAPIQLLRITLGIVLVGQLWDNISHDNLTAAGFRRLAEGFSERNSAPGAWDDVMRALAPHGAVLGPIQGIGEAAIAIGLLAGIAVAPSAFAFAGLLATLTLSELGIYWAWELPPLVAMAVAVGIASTPALREHGWRGLLVRPTAGGVLDRAGMPGRAVLALAVGAATWLYLDQARARPDIAIPTGITVAALLLVHVALDALAARRGRA